MRITRLLALGLLVGAPALAAPPPPPPPLPAPAEQPLTLTRAVELAVAGNSDLQRERIAIEVADAQLEALRGNYDFHLTTDLTFSRRTTPPLTIEDLQG